MSRISGCHFTCLLDSVPRGHAVFLPFDSKSDRRAAQVGWISSFVPYEKNCDRRVIRRSSYAEPRVRRSYTGVAPFYVCSTYMQRSLANSD
jgi:hypothetical protein